MTNTTRAHRSHSEALAEVPAEFRVVGYKTATGLVCRGHNTDVSLEQVTAAQLIAQVAKLCAVLGPVSVTYGCEVCGTDIGSL